MRGNSLASMFRAVAAGLAATAGASAVNFGNLRPMPGRSRTSSDTKLGRQLSGAKRGNRQHGRAHQGRQEIARRLRQIEKGMIHPVWGRD